MAAKYLEIRSPCESTCLQFLCQGLNIHRPICETRPDSIGQQRHTLARSLGVFEEVPGGCHTRHRHTWQLPGGLSLLPLLPLQLASCTVGAEE